MAAEEKELVGYLGGDRTLPVYRSIKRSGPPRVGLWADGPTSYFDNPRTMRTLDPTGFERELGLKGRNATAWCTALKPSELARIKKGRKLY